MNRVVKYIGGAFLAAYLGGCAGVKENAVRYENCFDQQKMEQEIDELATEHVKLERLQAELKAIMEKRAELVQNGPKVASR